MNGWLRVAAALVVLQGLFFAGWIWSELPDGGRVIRVGNRPVDPRDWLRGQYLALTYEMESSSAYSARDRDGQTLSGSPPPTGQTVYVALRRDPSTDGVFRPMGFDASREALLARLARMPDFNGDVSSPEADWVLVRGKSEGHGNFNFGIDRYFVPEGSKEPPRNARTVVLLHVDESGTPRIRGLEVDGTLWAGE